MIERIYSGADTQKEDDELFSLVVKDDTLQLSSGRLLVDDFTYPYGHMLRMAFVYKTQISFTYSNGVYTSAAHTLRAGDILKLEGATTGNGDYTISKVRQGKFYLPLVYVDGTLSLVRTVEASPLKSDWKKSTLSTPDIYSPKYEQTYDDGAFITKAFLLKPVPSYVIADYVTTLPYTINVTDSTTDIENYYSKKLIYRWIDECVITFTENVRDYQGRQMAVQTVIDNP